MQALEIKLEEGFYTFNYKQSSYLLRFIRGEWELTAQRMNYGGRFQMPSIRFFKTLQDLEKSIKGLVGISQLIEG